MAFSRVFNRAFAPGFVCQDEKKARHLPPWTGYIVKENVKFLNTPNTLTYFNFLLFNRSILAFSKATFAFSE